MPWMFGTCEKCKRYKEVFSTMWGFICWKCREQCSAPPKWGPEEAKETDTEMLPERKL